MVATLKPDIRVEAEQAAYGRVVTLLGLVARWLSDHRDQVRYSYLVPQPGWFLWYVLGRQVVDDDDMGEELSDFVDGLIRQGYGIDVMYFPGAIDRPPPPDAIVLLPADGGPARAD